jgi:hypothetical protein
MKTIFKSLYIKLTRWEFWPTRLVYFPVFIYYLWLALRSRSFFFFSLANPRMEMGGLYGASKYKQLRLLPDHLKPKTLFFKNGTRIGQILKQIPLSNINYPLIAKPDRAERGIGVKLITDQVELENYNSSIKSDFLIQEYIDHPFEAGVFFYRMPYEKVGEIPSIVVKEFLSVTGDGRSSIKKLIMKDDRALLAWESLQKCLGKDVNSVLELNEKKMLEPIGNHNRGTKFLNGNNLVSVGLKNLFSDISNHLPDFHYGRFDLKAPSIEDFLKGKNIKIMEVNGVNAEPAHIYDPSTKLADGIKTLLMHWYLIYKISDQNRAMGKRTPTLKEAVYYYKQWKISSNPKK